MRVLVDCSVTVFYAKSSVASECLLLATSINNVRKKRNAGPPGPTDRTARNTTSTGHSTFCGKGYSTYGQLVKAERLDLLIPTAERITEPHGAGS